ncbi:pilus assembly FimT family protein [Acinetobacter seifertii]|jgi:prepilin-type N-terminal cleavage/methylation domain|uniref:pilus assembly FimT family protein n=1 Tax=Acinetobacter seifertii TaxID=1530123 RepID=UPI000D37DA89|nr:prepilin-type N-terminal cleavage/methylation domain-containing protein [Acinetobacter seifertii]PTV52334.1 prepilin-type cleavage/methylation domain-containing protein [Acinetobacter seifertii]
MRGIIPQEGFTLIELIITIMVVAIIAIMAAPSMSNLLEENRFNDNQKKLIQTFYMAKSQAVLNRANISVNLNSNATNTSTAFNWIADQHNSLELKLLAADGTTTLLSTPNITFIANGTISNISQDLLVSMCNSQLHVEKSFILSKLGSIFVNPTGTC